MEHIPSLAEIPSGYATQVPIVTAEEAEQQAEERSSEWSQRFREWRQERADRAAQKNHGVIIFGSHKNFALLLDFEKYNKKVSDELELTYKTSKSNLFFSKKLKAKKLGIDNNAVLIFKRGEGEPRKQPQNVTLQIINDTSDTSAQKEDDYEYIEANDTDPHATALRGLECFQGIKKLFEENDLNYIILVRHGVSLHSVLKKKKKAWHKNKIRNSKLLPKQMVVEGPIFKQAYKLHKHLKSENVELIYCCSDLIRTQQSLVTFRCAYEWIMKLSNVVQIDEDGNELLPFACITSSRDPPQFSLESGAAHSVAADAVAAKKETAYLSAANKIADAFAAKKETASLSAANKIADAALIRGGGPRPSATAESLAAALALSKSLYYRALLDCLKTSMIPQLRSIYRESEDDRLVLQENFIKMLGHGDEDLTLFPTYIEELLYLYPPRLSRIGDPRQTTVTTADEEELRRMREEEEKIPDITHTQPVTTESTGAHLLENRPTPPSPTATPTPPPSSSSSSSPSPTTTPTPPSPSSSSSSSPSPTTTPTPPSPS
jgi:hypothetical protein